MTPFILGGLGLVVVVVAAVAFVLASARPAGPSEPAGQPVAIDGAHLAEFTDPAADAAVGQQLPTLSGVGMDGQPLEIGPDDGPMAIVVLAHWCPHCQAELPRIADFIAQGLESLSSASRPRSMRCVRTTRRPTGSTARAGRGRR